MKKKWAKAAQKKLQATIGIELGPKTQLFLQWENILGAFDPTFVPLSSAPMNPDAN